MLEVTLSGWRMLARATQAQAAELFGVSVRTWQRWESEGFAPIGPRDYFQMLATGVPVRAGSGFSHWKFWNDRLWSPEGVGFTAGEIRALPMKNQLISTLERTVAEPQQWRLL